MNPQDFGKYRLQEKIGQGGMAEVFYAHIMGREGFTKEVALKRVLPHLCEDADFVKSFVDEARLGGLLNHHHIVQTLDFGQEQGIYYLAMEYVHGLTLREVINYHNKQRTPIPPSIVLDLILQFCDGLRYAHNAEDEMGNPLNMVHRDLKPTNILVSSHGVVKIADFGIARAETNLRRTTYDGVLKGTAQYMSPEQALGDLSIDRRSDIFSVGSIAYEMISLRSLFYDPTNSIKTLRNVQDANVGDALAALQRDFPYALKLIPILEWLLQRDRSRRPGGIEEVLPELRRIHASLSRQLDMQGWAEQILVALGRPVRSRRSTTQTMRTIPVSALGGGPPAPSAVPLVPAPAPEPLQPPAAAARPAPPPSGQRLPPGFVAGRPAPTVQEPSGGGRPAPMLPSPERSGGASARPVTTLEQAQSLLGPLPSRAGTPSGPSFAGPSSAGPASAGSMFPATALSTATLADVPIRPPAPPAHLGSPSGNQLPPPSFLPSSDEERTAMGLELDEEDNEGARATVSITEQELRQAVTAAARGNLAGAQPKPAGTSPSQPFQLQLPPPLPPPRTPQGFALPPPNAAATDDWADLRTTALEVPKVQSMGGPAPGVSPSAGPRLGGPPVMDRKVQLGDPGAASASPAGASFQPRTSPSQSAPNTGKGLPGPMPAMQGFPPAPTHSPAPVLRQGASSNIPPNIPPASVPPPHGSSDVKPRGDWSDIQTRAIDPSQLPDARGPGGFVAEVTQPDPFPPGLGGGSLWNSSSPNELPPGAKALVQQMEEARASTAAALIGGGSSGGAGPSTGHLRPQAPPGVMVAQVRHGHEPSRGWGPPDGPATTLMDSRPGQAQPGGQGNDPARAGMTPARENSQPGFSAQSGLVTQPAWGQPVPVHSAPQGWQGQNPAIPMAGGSGQAGQGPAQPGAFGTGAPGHGQAMQANAGYPGSAPMVEAPGGRSGGAAPSPQPSPALAKKLPLGLVLAGLGLLVAIGIAIALMA